MNMLIQEQDVSDQLSRLLLTLEIIDRVRAVVLEIINSSPPWDVLTGPNAEVWRQATNKLRELLLPLGFTAKTIAGLEFTVSPDGEFALLFHRGDRNVANLERLPQPARPRGPATINFFQPFLPGFEKTQQFNSTLPFKVWVVFVFVDVKAQTVAAELACPTLMNASGEYDGYQTRIVLPLFTTIPTLPTVEPNFVQSVVTVERKKGT